jgi:hypothetical protein
MLDLPVMADAGNDLNGRAARNVVIGPTRNLDFSQPR